MALLNSDITEALHYALNLHASGKTARALFVYRAIVSRCPERIDLFLNIGTALHDLERYAEAVEVYQHAIAINPLWWEAHYNLGNSLMALDRHQEAIEHYEKCFAINPDYVEALVTKGTALEFLGRYSDACDVYDSAIARKFDCAEAHWNRSLALLRQGRFLEGWREYEWRWLKKGYTTSPRSFDCPLWDGSELNGASILIHSEQAYGDMLQFIRYAPLVVARGGKVIVECPSPLIKLLSGVDGVAQVISPGSSSHLDYHVPLLSLPLIFATTLNTIPLHIPYVNIPPATMAHWSNLVIRDGTLRVGLVWAGRKTPDPHRTCGLKALIPLAGIKGVTYYSLQIEEFKEGSDTEIGGFDLVDLTDGIHDFADTAALIENLDLVITIDTATAHLAGALGKQVFIMVPCAPDWRWMLGRNDSPWYPTMRIFRQKCPNDWQEVVSELKEELNETLIKDKAVGAVH